MGTQQTNADKKRVCTPSIGATKEKQTVQMVYDSPYTVYNIEEEVDLHGGTLLLPEGCTLNFRGGSFRNGILKGNRTRICRSDNYIFKDNLQLEGT
ncbi:MAG: hypothetical protein LUF04_06080, partial [Bacteroides sp.]|nr:hypothetical protein [Bacteroides sp.]